MNFLFILAAVAALPEPRLDHFSSMDSVMVTVQTDNVELNGAGRLDFEPDSKSLYANLSAIGERSSGIVRLWLDPNGHPISCDVGQATHSKISQVGCAQLMKSANFYISPGYAMPFRRGFVDVQFHVSQGPNPANTENYVVANSTLAYANTTIIYPPDLTTAEKLLSNTDGNFSISVTRDDYPAIAMRYNLESRSSVLLGINRDGYVRSCRPVSAFSGTSTAFLDNYTCTLFTNRGHFNFRPTFPIYDGLRYWHSRMSWKIGG